MKRLLFLLLLPFTVFAQYQTASLSNPVGGNMSAQAATTGACATTPNACVWQKIPSPATTTTITITGTFSGTLTIEYSADSGNTWTTSSTQTAPTVVTLTTTSYTDIRVRFSTFSSGIASANIQTSGSTGGAGGSGGVSSVSCVAGCSVANGSTAPAITVTSGTPTVTSGLIADCPLTETAGTTVNCGSVNGTLGSGFNAPVPTSSTNGTVLAMDNFSNAALNTAGNWTVTDGAFTTASNQLTTSGVGGDTFASAFYSGIPSSLNQWASAVFSTAPNGVAGAGVAVHMQPTGSNYYACNVNSTTFFLIKVVAGTATTLASQAFASAQGHVLTMTAITNPNLSTVSLACLDNGTPVVSVNDTTPIIEFSGSTGIFSGGTGAPKFSNFLTGNFNVSTAGGFIFGGGQYISLPSSLNSALTLEVYACYQNSSNTNQDNALIIGNGNGAASNANGIDLSGAASTGNNISGTIPHIFTVGGSAYTTASFLTFNGCGTAIVSYGSLSPTSLDRNYLNGTEAAPYVQAQQGAAAGLQTVGNYQIGGAAAGSGLAGSSYYTGVIYRVRVFNRVLSPAEVAQDNAALVTALQGRGINPSVGSNAALDTAVVIGDSISSGFGLASANTQAWGQNLTLYNPANSQAFANGGKPWIQAMTAAYMAAYNSVPGPSSALNPGPSDQLVDPLYTYRGGRNVLIIFACTNDLIVLSNTGVGAGKCIGDMGNFARLRRLQGWKVIVVSMISRGASGSCTQDPNKDAFNPLLRNYWNTFADGLVDLAADTNFADGGCTGTAYQADNTHPSVHGHINLIAPRMQAAVNRVYGNRSFSEATTYGSAAAAAVATTAVTESTNTVTVTFTATPANCQVGNIIVLAGITSASYNGNWLILTRSATQVTYFNPTSGLSNATVQGTGVCAQQQDQDVYSILNFGAGNFTLESCVGYTGQNIYVKNINAVASTVVPFGSETIDGSASLSVASKATLLLQSILTSNTAGGCSWKQLQNN